MRVFTPEEVAKDNESKYLGVLVAAKYAKELNKEGRNRRHYSQETEKFTTRALVAITSGKLDYRLVKRDERTMRREAEEADGIWNVGARKEFSDASSVMRMASGLGEG